MARLIPRLLGLASFYFLTFLTIALLTVLLLARLFIDDLALINFPVTDFFTALGLEVDPQNRTGV